MLAIDLFAIALATALFGWVNGQNANAESDAASGGKDFENHGAE